jgi:hypothetical protein
MPIRQRQYSAISSWHASCNYFYPQMKCLATCELRGFFSTSSPHGVEMRGVGFGSTCRWDSFVGYDGFCAWCSTDVRDSNGIRLVLRPWTVSMLRKDAHILMALQHLQNKRQSVSESYVPWCTTCHGLSFAWTVSDITVYEFRSSRPSRNYWRLLKTASLLVALTKSLMARSGCQTIAYLRIALRSREANQ